MRFKSIVEAIIQSDTFDGVTLEGMESGKVVHKNAYELPVNEKVTRVLLDYLQQEGLIDAARRLTAGGKPLVVGSQMKASFGDSMYTIQRDEYCRNSNMHWLTPADARTNNKVLEILGDSGFDDILEAIGTALGLGGLAILQSTLICMSSCTEGKVHVDSEDTDDKAFTLILPLILPQETEAPHLNIFDDHDKETYGGYTYKSDIAVLLGDDATHASAKAQYSGKGAFRMMATFLMADVTKHNAKKVKECYSQREFCPNPLTLAASHWKKGDKSVKLPRSQEA